MTIVNTYLTRISPCGGVAKDGLKLGYVADVTKSAQNDKLAIKNARAIVLAWPQVVSTGAGETYTTATGTNVITLTSATTGTSDFSALVLYQ
jgi:hypothetical protein